MLRTIDILAVDDRTENLLAMEGLLQEPGINIIKASSGNEALGLMLDHDFALVLLDVQMPEMDGYETAELMRSLKKTRETPIIFVTAINIDRKHIFKGYESGAVDYLCKPFDPEILQSKVKVFCDLYMAKLRAEMDRKLLEATMHSIGDGVIAADTKGFITFINPAAARLIGRDQQEAIGRPLDEVFKVTGKDGMPAPLPAPPYDNSGKNGSGKTRGGLAGNSPLPIEYGFDPIIDDNAEVLGLILAFNDISARMEMEQENKKLERQLRQSQKMEAIGTMAGGIAHDFNNILSVIINASEMAVLDGAGGEDISLYLEMTLKAANRAKDLVKQILAFSRHSTSEFIPVQPHILLKEDLRLVRSTVPATIEIRQRIEQDCGVINADPTQLHQLIMNLCNNAVHAMDEKGVLEIQLRQITIGREELLRKPELRPGKYVCLSVTDSGCGMDAEVMEHIFDPFFTTKDVGEGTGMGLSVVHGIVKSHGGAIEVESEPGKGAAFHVILPVVDTAAGAAKDQEAAAPGGTERILFIDDEQMLADLGSKVIEQLGYRVTVQTDSNDALKTFRAGPDNYDLVITDQTMPKLSGIELIEEMKKIKPGVRVILCTGYSKKISAESNKRHGIQNILLKPLIKDELARTIRKVLDG